MKRPRHLLRPGAPLPRLLLLVSHVLLCSALGVLSSRAVTLSSIEIYRTHEWLGEPNIYFQCRGENITFLPDVKKKNIVYTFKGEESWQPLTELPETKCKRCGIYEKDTIKSDDVFDEWELCPGDFLDGKEMHIKDKEFNATFICLQCTRSAASERNTESKSEGDKKVNAGVLIIICVLASIVTVLGIVAICRYWQKKKREQDQARFLKLFEEGDDIEDELGLGHVI